MAEMKIKGTGNKVAFGSTAIARIVTGMNFSKLAYKSMFK